jgi:hypothetical protein
MIINRKLLLFLSKDDYQKVGLTGKKHLDKYKIELDLSNQKESFKARLKWCLQNTFVKTIDYNLIHYENESKLIVFKDIINEKMDLESYNAKMKNIKVPKYLMVDTEIDQLSKLELLEWVGLCAIESDRLSIQSKVDPFICNLKEPQGSKIGNVNIMKLSGFIIPEYIQGLNLRGGWNVVSVKTIKGSLLWKEQAQKGDVECGYVLVNTKNSKLSYHYAG